MTHIMLDLETWGLKPGSDIRSIGAVVFDPVAGKVSVPCTTCKGGKSHGTISTFSGDCSDCMNTRMEGGYGDTFYVATDNLEITKDYEIVYGQYFLDTESGRRSKYPLTRDPETVKWWNDQSPEAQAAFANPVDLREACLKFADWFFTIGPVPEIRVWSKGPHFDIAILAAVYDAVGLPVPWHYRAPRDMRTIVEAAGITKDEEKAMFTGTPHNALDDAISQAMTVCEAYKRLGINNG